MRDVPLRGNSDSPTPLSNHCAVMPERPPPNLGNPEFWRYRAEEARTIADGMRDGEPKKIMVRIAESYERIAKMIEQGVQAEK